MKVSKLWMLTAIFLIGMLCGCFLTQRVIMNNTPAGNEISIGTIKLKGRDNILKTDLKLEENATEQTRKEKRRNNKTR